MADRRPFYCSVLSDGAARFRTTQRDRRTEQRQFERNFTRNGEVLPPLTTAKERWRRLVVDARGIATVQFMDDRFLAHEFAIDDAAHTMTLSRRGERILFAWEKSSDEGLVLRSQAPNGGDAIELRAVPAAALLPLLAERPHQRGR